MMNDIKLYTKLTSLPEELKKEANDFIDFLKFKSDPDDKKPKKIAGLAKGLIQMKEGFDEPLDDFHEYMN